MNPEKRTILPQAAFSGYFSRYRRPTCDEGFADITTVDFEVSLRCDFPCRLQLCSAISSANQIQIRLVGRHCRATSVMASILELKTYISHQINASYSRPFISV